MGLTVEKGTAAPQRGAAALFGSLFSKPVEHQHPVAASTTGTPSLLPAQMSRARSGSTLSTATSKSSSRGFFTTLGTAIQTQLSPASPPASPSRRPTRNQILEPDATLLVDEFAGISFRQLISSYTLEPTAAPESPEEALKNTPEGRLGELSVTAADLLERVYAAYQSRTSSLASVLSAHADTTELLEESRSRTSQYKLQLERLATDEQDARDEQNFRITVQERRIKQLEAAVQSERAKREEAEEELRRTADRERKKRTSAASDSGFESDGDSLFSRDRASMVVSPVESFMDGVDEHTGGGTRRDSLTPSTYTVASRTDSGRCESCSHCQTSIRSLTPSSASIRNPTPLSQAWSPDSDGSGEKTPTQTPVSSPPSATAVPTPTKWGFGSLTRKAGAAVAWSGGNVEEVRSENRVLRARVGELERVVDDCLEFVAGRERVVVFRGT